MADVNKMRTHFENILGRPLDREDDDPVVLRERVGLYTFYPGDILRSDITSRDIGTNGESTKACISSSVVRINGVAMTNAQGTVEFLVNDFICLGGITYFYPANVIATPRGRRPVFLTLNHTLLGNQSDFDNIKIIVFSWDANGNPAPGILFDWQCIVPCSTDVE